MAVFIVYFHLFLTLDARQRPKSRNDQILSHQAGTRMEQSTGETGSDQIQT